MPLIIINPKITQSCSGVFVEWNTSQLAAGYVVFGTQAVVGVTLGSPHGYQTESLEKTSGTTMHRILLQGATPGTTYFARAVSFVPGYAPILGSELSITPQDIPCTGAGGPVLASSCPYISEYMWQGHAENTEQVFRLQLFLKYKEGIDTPINGHFDVETKRAVKEFQVKYRSDILEPLGIIEPTGNVHIYTRAKINELMGCGKEIITAPVRQVSSPAESTAPAQEALPEILGRAPAPIIELSIATTVHNTVPANTEQLASAIVPITDIIGTSSPETCEICNKASILIDILTYAQKVICRILNWW